MIVFSADRTGLETSRLDRHTSWPDTTTHDPGHTLVWNAWNELAAVKSGGTTLASYSYDGTGRLITTTVGGSSTDTYFNGEQDIETRTGVTSTSNGTLATENVFSPDYTNDLLLRDSYSGGTFSQRVYFTHDATYDVTAELNSSGTVLQRQVYSAYGTVTFYNSSWTSTSDGYNLTHLWQGGQRDATTGMYLFQARWYSVTMQRWMSVDPTQADGMNWYRGFGGNPIDYADPTGLQMNTNTGGAPDPRGPVTGDGLLQGVPGSGWKWFPDPQNSRGGEWKIPGSGNQGTTASWDANPKGPQGKPGKPHWDYRNGNDRDANGRPKLRHLDPNGKGKNGTDIPEEECHPDGPPDDKSPPSGPAGSAPGTPQANTVPPPDLGPAAFTAGMSAVHAPEVQTFIQGAGNFIQNAEDQVSNFLDWAATQAEEAPLLP